MIDKYVASNPSKSKVYTSLGQLRYLSSLQFIDMVLGNSSSGIIEAPSFKIATVNIGNRQKGRIVANSVINTQAIKQEIQTAINTIYTQEFQENLKNMQNPYDKESTSKNIIEILKGTDLSDLLKKTFYDLKE